MDWILIRKIGQIILALLPWILALFSFHQWAYNKFPKYYFTFLRFFSKWRDTKWSVSARYLVEINENFYNDIEKILRNRYGNFKRTVNMKNKKLFECGNYNLMVYDDTDMGPHSIGEVWFNISQLNVTLNSAEEYLRDLRELFHQIEITVKPKSKGYSMDVFFPNNKNPFFGLMIQRLGEKNIASFECVFPISVITTKKNNQSNGDYMLRVFKDKITINDESFDILEETAKNALLFK